MAFRKPTLASLLTLAFVAGISVGQLTSVSANLRGSGLFRDVDGTHWADVAIGSVYDAGILKGDANGGTFRPNDFVTRAELAAVVARISGLDDGSGARNTPTVTRRSSSSSSVTRRSSSSTRSTSSPTTTSKVKVNFGNPNLSFPEGAGGASFTVIRSDDDGEASVYYETVADTATKGDDYTDVSGTINFRPGVTTETVTLSLKKDGIGEVAETFKVKLSKPNNLSLGTDAEATITILDADGGAAAAASSSSSSANATAGAQGRLGFAAAGYGISEDGDKLVVTVERTEGTSGPVTVDYETVADTAKGAGSDYNDASGTLSFADGETSKTFEVAIIDNTDSKGKKIFAVKLKNITGGAVFGLSEANVDIYDNEIQDLGKGKFRLSDNIFSGDEPNSSSENATIEVTIERMNGTDGEVTVDFATTDNTAKKNADFDVANGTLTFKDGEAKKNVSIKLLSDSNNENTENFTFTISNPTGGSELNTPTSATVEIKD